MLPEEDQATATDSVCRKFDQVHVWFLKYACCQTDAHTYLFQYFCPRLSHGKHANQENSKAVTVSLRKSPAKAAVIILSCEKLYVVYYV